jgi:hypothetical protein
MNRPEKTATFKMLHHVNESRNGDMSALTIGCPVVSAFIQHWGLNLKAINRLQRKLRNAGGDEAAANYNLAAPLAQIQHSLRGRIVLFGGAPAIIEATRVFFADQKAAGIAWVAHVAAAIFTPMASVPAKKRDRGGAVGITPAYRVAEVIKWQLFDEVFSAVAGNFAQSQAAVPNARSAFSSSLHKILSRVSLLFLDGIGDITAPDPLPVSRVIANFAGTTGR